MHVLLVYSIIRQLRPAQDVSAWESSSSDAVMGGSFCMLDIFLLMLRHEEYMEATVRSHWLRYAARPPNAELALVVVTCATIAGGGIVMAETCDE